MKPSNFARTPTMRFSHVCHFTAHPHFVELVTHQSARFAKDQGRLTLAFRFEPADLEMEHPPRGARARENAVQFWNTFHDAGRGLGDFRSACFRSARSRRPRSAQWSAATSSSRLQSRSPRRRSDPRNDSAAPSPNPSRPTAKRSALSDSPAQSLPLRFLFGFRLVPTYQLLKERHFVFHRNG